MESLIADFHIDRILNLQDPHDREALRLAAAPHPGLTTLIQDNLDHALRFLEHPDWHRVYSGGMIAVRVGPKLSFGTDLARVLELGSALERISAYPRFNLLLANLKVPTQIKATAFEATSAAWCSQRMIHRSLEFYPGVDVNGHKKKPDFLWHTTLGDIYVECKTTNSIESKFSARLTGVSQDVGTQYDLHNSWQGTRLNVVVDTLRGNVADSIQRVVSEAAAAAAQATWKGAVFKHGSISAFLTDRGAELVVDQKYAHFSQVMIEKTGVAVPISDARWRVLLPAERYREESVAKALKDARSQLPTNQTNAVFIEAERSTAAMQSRLLKTISLPDYTHVQWVSLWAFGHYLWAGWTEGQPFTDNVLKAAQ